MNVIPFCFLVLALFCFVAAGRLIVKQRSNSELKFARRHKHAWLDKSDDPDS